MSKPRQGRAVLSATACLMPPRPSCRVGARANSRSTPWPSEPGQQGRPALSFSVQGPRSSRRSSRGWSRCLILSCTSRLRRSRPARGGLRGPSSRWASNHPKGILQKDERLRRALLAAVSSSPLLPHRCAKTFPLDWRTRERRPAERLFAARPRRDGRSLLLENVPDAFAEHGGHRLPQENSIARRQLPGRGKRTDHLARHGPPKPFPSFMRRRSTLIIVAAVCVIVGFGLGIPQIRDVISYYGARRRRAAP